MNNDIKTYDFQVSNEYVVLPEVNIWDLMLTLEKPRPISSFMMFVIWLLVGMTGFMALGLLD